VLLALSVEHRASADEGDAALPLCYRRQLWQQQVPTAALTPGLDWDALLELLGRNRASWRRLGSFHRRRIRIMEVLRCLVRIIQLQKH